MLRYLCKIVLRIIGWKAVGIFPPSLKKAVVAVAPHTSSRDVIICLIFRKALHLERFKFLGKKELFTPPFGFIFRWLGGVPVDRVQNTHLVDDVVNLYNKNPEFIIALSPEGTRKKVDRLRTGFYYIAKKAAVPIVMLGLDFENKQLIFSDAFYTGNNEQEDFERIIQFFAPINGRYPERGIGHLLQEGHSPILAARNK